MFTLIEKDHLGDRSPEKDCCYWLTFRQPVRKPSSETLKMASAQVVETSVNNNSPSQDSYHPDDLFQSRYATPGFKPFSYYDVWWKSNASTRFLRGDQENLTKTVNFFTEILHVCVIRNATTLCQCETCWLFAFLSFFSLLSMVTMKMNYLTLFWNTVCLTRGRYPRKLFWSSKGWAFAKHVLRSQPL